MSSSRYDAIVVGAGLHGLAAAWHLRRLGCPRVALLERFELGHDRGSSHGTSRITRATYPSEVYVHLLHAANREEWPRLESESGTTLIRKRSGCFFGPGGGRFDPFVKTMADFKNEVEFLSVERAARVFPQFRFEGMAGVLHDRTAGIVAAADTLDALTRRCREKGVEIREHTRVTGLVSGDDGVEVQGPGRPLTADRVVVTAGAWSAGLLPFLKSRLRVVRQNVGYFRFETPVNEDFPVWAFVGRETNDFYYGLPQEDGTVKAARHVVEKQPDDPDAVVEPAPDALEDLQGVVTRHFTFPPRELVRAEACLYTNTPTEDFIIDTHPEDSRIVFGAGFSGHGFKFGPLTGRILAELAMFGGSQVVEFNRFRKTFSLD